MSEKDDKGSECFIVAAVLMCLILVGMWFYGKAKENEARKVWPELNQHRKSR